MKDIIHRDDHLTALEIAEAIEAGNQRCPECGDTGPGDKLYLFSTVHRARARIHDGAFCSKDCHDVYHGLKPRRGKP